MKKVYRQKYVTTDRDIAERLREMASMVEKGCIRFGHMELDLENRQTWSVKVSAGEEKASVTMKISWKVGMFAPEIEDRKNEILTIDDDSKLT